MEVESTKLHRWPCVYASFDMCVRVCVWVGKERQNGEQGVRGKTEGHAVRLALKLSNLLFSSVF